MRASPHRGRGGSPHRGRGLFRASPSVTESQSPLPAGRSSPSWNAEPGLHRRELSRLSWSSERLRKEALFQINPPSPQRIPRERERVGEGRGAAKSPHPDPLPRSGRGERSRQAGGGVRTRLGQDQILAWGGVDRPVAGCDPGFGWCGPTSTRIRSRFGVVWTDQYQDLILALGGVDRPVPGSDPGFGWCGPAGIGLSGSLIV